MWFSAIDIVWLCYDLEWIRPCHDLERIRPCPWHLLILPWSLLSDLIFEQKDFWPQKGIFLSFFKACFTFVCFVQLPCQTYVLLERVTCWKTRNYWKTKQLLRFENESYFHDKKVLQRLRIECCVRWGYFVPYTFCESETLTNLQIIKIFWHFLWTE